VRVAARSSLWSLETSTEAANVGVAHEARGCKGENVMAAVAKKKTAKKKPAAKKKPVAKKKKPAAKKKK
jgi:hypothetical protein